MVARISTAWAIGLGFMTWWVADSATPAPEVRRRRSFVVPIPAVAVLAGLAVLLVGTQVTLSTLAVVLAGLTVGLAAVPIIFRQAMLGRVLATQEEGQRLRAAVLRLPDGLRFTVSAHFWGGLAVKEIATLENITTVGIRKRLHRAFSLLEAILDEEAK